MIRFVSYLIVFALTSLAIGAAEAGDTTIAFEDANGNALTLADFKGQPVLLNLWATWCGPCIAEMPLIADVQQQYAAQGLKVITLSEDDSRMDAAAYFKSKGIVGLTPYFDAGHHAWHTLHASGIPASYFIDRNGDIIRFVEGYVDWQTPGSHKALAELMGK